MFSLLVHLPVHAQWTQQSITLKPGWNAVFLNVHPEPAGCDELFAGLPVEGVWDWNRQSGNPQFVEDPAALVPGTDGWLTWFPPGHALAGQTNLFILRDGRPYLIQLADTASPVTWTVVGKPSLRKLTWRPGEANLVGFRVGATAPTFQALFAGESGLAGQPVYELDAAGAWRAVANLATARPQAGAAYWVRCRSPAQRTGTIDVDTGTRDGVRFLDDQSETFLRVRNTSPAARNLTMRMLPSLTPPQGQPPEAGAFPLDYWKADQTNQSGWEPFPSTLSFNALPAGAEWQVRLGVRRAAAATAPPSGAEYQGVLEISDDLGTRWLVPVNAEAGTAGAARHATATASARAGLWIGEAVLKAVSQPAHAGNPTLTRPAGGEFRFRILVHVDGRGAARLLQRAHLVRQPPVLAPDPANPGVTIVAKPSRTLVVSDESLLPGLLGSGEIVGRRVSSAAFGFSQPLALTGAGFGTGTLTGSVTLGYNDPLNPFKHRYHPDHDNLDSRFEETLPEGRESFTVTRQITLTFTGDDPLELNPPSWGDSEVGGDYRETLTGLHRSAISTSGTFRLVRVTRTPELDE